MNDVSINFILNNNVEPSGQVADLMIDELNNIELPQHSTLVDLLPLNGMEKWWFNVLTLINIGAVNPDHLTGLAPLS
jgi:hypothetical protein